MKETLLKNQILDYLKYKNVFCWLTNTMGNFSKASQSYYKNPRLLSGVSDIIGILPDGKLLAIECKVGKNKLTEPQEEFKKNIINNNGLHILAYELEDIIKYFPEKGDFKNNNKLNSDKLTNKDYEIQKLGDCI